MRRFLAWLFNKPLIWTEDFDAEVRLRIGKFTPFNKLFCVGIGCEAVVCNVDGTTSGSATYVKKWLPANKKAEEILNQMKRVKNE